VRARVTWILALALLSACAQTRVFRAEPFERRLERGRVLLLPADVQITEMSLGGVETPQAQWTEMAAANLTRALDYRLGSRSLELVRYDAAKRADPELLILSRVVGSSVLAFKYGSSEVLPTLKSSFDWSVGSRAAELGDAYNADYAIALAFRDGFASAERATATVAVAVLGGALPTPVQFGYAFLIDLRTGQVVWFNRMLLQRGVIETLDPRDPSGAQSVLDNLIQDFPL